METEAWGAERADPASGAAAPRGTYQPHLDGLRAVAVYLVVLFHSGVAAFSGGYIGVDVFFVLSGYLVTGVLLRDLATNGVIRFGRFYSRRVRRLLPAAFCTLIVSGLVFTAIATPTEVRAAAGSFRAAFLYSANWYFIRQSTGYFGADLTSNPVLHFWSLAVEEQFYLLWPLLLGAAFVITRRLGRERQVLALRVLVGGAALASATWALSLRASHPNHAYFGTDARAYELLAGALLALAPDALARLRASRSAVRAASIAAMASLILLASSWIHGDAIVRGVATTLATVVLLFALETRGPRAVPRLLSTRSVVYLGKISYGTYLWHLIVGVVIARSFHAGPVATLGITALVGTALAALSFELVEHPIRVSPFLDRYGRTVVVGGLACSLVAAVVLVPLLTRPADASAPIARGATTGFTPVPRAALAHPAFGRGPFVNCRGKPVSACRVVSAGGARVLLIGDSHAQMLIPTFTRIARARHLTLFVSVQGACPWQLGLTPTSVVVNGQPFHLSPARCDAQRDDLYARVLTAVQPDVVVAVDAPDYDARDIARLTVRSVARLRATGAKIVLVEPFADAPFDPVTCLSGARYVEACRYVVSSKPNPFAVEYRALADRDHDVIAADFSRLVCPFFPICDPFVNHVLVKYNASHITPAFARTLAVPVASYLQAAGVLGRRNQ